MKRFRFTPQALLEWRRKRLEATEEELRRLQWRRREALDRAAACQAESQQTLKRLAAGAALTGRDLREADAWRDRLALHAMTAAEEARRLEAQSVELRRKLVQQSRNVEILERLRKRRLREHKSEQAKRLEQLAAELHLAGRSR